MIHTVQLRKFFSAFLLAIVLAVSIFSTTGLPVLAKALTPEANAYEVGQNSKLQEKAQSGKRAEREVGSSAQLTDQPVEDKNALERTADNIREKLNLDEPVPQSTKDFLNSVKGK